VAIDGKKAHDCSGINRGAFALFNESTKILLPQTAYDMLVLNLNSKKRIDSPGYACVPGEMDGFPNISIYTSQYKINIPPVSYMDYNNVRMKGEFLLNFDIRCISVVIVHWQWMF